jgi:AbrB family looped-hinge helix DNA binding protein
LNQVKLSLVGEEASVGTRDVLTVSAKGQVVIPHAIRLELGITPGSEVEAYREGNGVVIRLKHARPMSTLEDGVGMLKYAGKKKLADFDVATEMRKQATKRK